MKKSNTHAIPGLVVAVLLAFVPCAVASAQDGNQQISLWSDGAPVGDGTTEKVDVRITVYRPAVDKANKMAMVVCAGGGYGMVTKKGEGPGLAEWLVANGIVGVVLDYRLPRHRPYVPLLDAQRALRTVRAHAADWGVDPNRIGIIGFSAGGHLASSAVTHFDEGNPKADDPVERLSSRPDFGVLIYPVISMGELTHKGSRNNLLGPDPKPELVRRFSNDTQVTGKTPPVFLAHALNDTMVVPANSRLFHQALLEHKVPTEFLELPSGGHGLNGNKGPMWDAWQKACLIWLRDRFKS